MAEIYVILQQNLLSYSCALMVRKFICVFSLGNLAQTGNTYVNEGLDGQSETNETRKKKKYKKKENKYDNGNKNQKHKKKKKGACYVVT